jgi:hypothetical protein
LKGFFFIQSYREGDLGLLKELRIFGLLQDLVKVRVDSLRDSAVFSFHVVLLAKLEAFDSSGVVELKHLRILSKTIKNDFGNIKEEVDSWENSMLVFHSRHLAVSKKDELIRVDFTILVHSISVRVFVEELQKLLLSLSFLNLSDDLVSLVPQSFKDQF